MISSSTQFYNCKSYMKPISHLRKASITYNSMILEAMYLTIPITLLYRRITLQLLFLQAAALLPHAVALFLQAAALLPQAVALFLQASV